MKKLLFSIFMIVALLLCCCTNTKQQETKKDVVEVEKIADIKGIPVNDSVQNFLAKIDSIGVVKEKKYDKKDNSYTYKFKKTTDGDAPYISDIAVHAYNGLIERIEVFYENTSIDGLTSSVKNKYKVYNEESVEVEDGMWGTIRGYKVGKTLIKVDCFSGLMWIGYQNYEVIKKHKSDDKQKEKDGLNGNV